MIYSWVHYLHLLSVSCFFGGILCVHTLKLMSDRSTDGQALIAAAVALDRRIAAPAAALLTITGLALWWVRGLELGFNWITFLAVSWFLLAAVGTTYLAPRLRQLALNWTRGHDVKHCTRNSYWNRVSAGAIIASAVLLYLASHVAHG